MLIRIQNILHQYEIAGRLFRHIDRKTWQLLLFGKLYSPQKLYRRGLHWPCRVDGTTEYNHSTGMYLHWSGVRLSNEIRKIDIDLLSTNRANHIYVSSHNRGFSYCWNGVLWHFKIFLGSYINLSWICDFKNCCVADTYCVYFFICEENSGVGTIHKKDTWNSIVASKPIYDIESQ